MDELEVTPETKEVAKPKGKPGRKPRQVEAESPKVDLEMVQMLIKQMQEGNRELAAELRKPTELEQKKLDDERESRIKRAQQSIAAAKQKERMDLALQAQCRSENHARPDGVTRFRAQVNSNGFFVPVCLKCHIELPPVKATPEEIQNGVMLGNYRGITEEALIQLGKYRNQQVA